MKKILKLKMLNKNIILNKEKGNTEIENVTKEIVIKLRY